MKYLKIIFCFLLFVAIIQAVFAQVENGMPMIKSSASIDQGVIYVVFNPKDSIYSYDTTYRSKPYRDFFYSDDSLHVADRVKYRRI